MRPTVVVAVIAEGKEYDADARGLRLRERSIATQVEIRPMPVVPIDTDEVPGLRLFLEIQGGMPDREYAVDVTVHVPDGTTRRIGSAKLTFAEPVSIHELNFPASLRIPVSGLYWYVVLVDGHVAAEVPLRADFSTAGDFDQRPTS